MANAFLRRYVRVAAEASKPHPLFAALAFAALVAFALLHQRSRAARMRAEDAALTARYAALHAQTLTAARSAKWPDRAARAGLLRGVDNTGPHGRPEPVRFASDGPLGIAAFLDGGGAALVARARRAVFAPLVAALGAALDEPARRRFEAGVYWNAEPSLHSIVTVFSEHPSLLEPSERRAWRPVSDEAAAALAERLGATALSPSTPAPVIELSGYALTADGTMVLLFSDGAASGGGGGRRHGGRRHGGIARLREQISSIGTSVLGPLNSRPKRLVHVTAGRILDWPYAQLDDAAAERVGRVVEAWASALAAGELPAGAPDGGGSTALPGLGERLVLREVELCRDVRWMMVERRTLRRFGLRDMRKG